MRNNILVNKPIVLVGMMGSGKSTIGKKLASKLNVQFYDSDKIIEEREGLSVLDIFDYRGEEYFNNKEVEVISEILNYGPVVLSTGGSSFMIERVRQLVKDSAVSIWLDTKIETIHERVSRRNTRPLLNVGNKLEVIQQMVDERAPLYQLADIKVESGDMDAHYVVDTLLLKLKGFFPSENKMQKFG
jgi:shikimate kinase